MFIASRSCFVHSHYGPGGVGMLKYSLLNAVHPLTVRQLWASKTFPGTHTVHQSACMMGFSFFFGVVFFNGYGWRIGSLAPNVLCPLLLDHSCHDILPFIRLKTIPLVLWALAFSHTTQFSIVVMLLLKRPRASSEWDCATTPVCPAWAAHCCSTGTYGVC